MSKLLLYNLLLIIVVTPLVVTVVSNKRGKEGRNGTEVSFPPSEWLFPVPPENLLHLLHAGARSSEG